MKSSAPASSKRARAPGNGTPIPSCLVDGCTADLGKCRDYHRRHKVCELHSKTPRVYIQGQEQRFCQQCSRFHSLEEFDEGKRSCRKRLDGHNRRRRKPHQDSLPINCGNFLSNTRDTKFIPFGSPHLLSTNLVPPAWAGILKDKTDLMICNNHSQLDFSNWNSFQGSSSHNNNGGKQFPFFFEGATSALPVASSVFQPLLTANTSSVNCDSSSSSSSSQKVFSKDRLNRVVDSSRALSLLSSPPQHETQAIDLNHMMQQTNAIPPAQCLNYSGLGGMDSEPIRSALVTDSNSNANLHGQDTFEDWSL